MRYFVCTTACFMDGRKWDRFDLRRAEKKPESHFVEIKNFMEGLYIGHLAMSTNELHETDPEAFTSPDFKRIRPPERWLRPPGELRILYQTRREAERKYFSLTEHRTEKTSMFVFKELDLPEAQKLADELNRTIRPVKGQRLPVVSNEGWR